MARDEQFSKLLTPVMLKKYASERTYERGVAYFASGKVTSLVHRGNVITGIVKGTQTYQAEIRLTGTTLQYACSCPVHGFCKHLVAVGLAWNGDEVVKPIGSVTTDQHPPISEHMSRKSEVMKPLGGLTIKTTRKNPYAKRINEMRHRLLDLSRRNPLLSTRFSANSASILRVVDEMPEVIVRKLCGGDKLTFVPLPSLGDSDPLEETAEFKDALSYARLEDFAYRSALSTVEQTAEENLDKVQLLERELKDRVRASLGLPPRQEKPDQTSLRQHAINCGISPNYELPLPTEAHADGRHHDNHIQTLLLHEQLDRRLNTLHLRCRTIEQETGINPLKIAFGFLEWQDQNMTSSSYAPLILLPVHLEKLLTPTGSEFRVSATEGEAEGNIVLDMKFRTSFDTALPKYEDFRRQRSPQDGTREVSEKEAPEEYFAEIGAISHKSLKKCKIHRQITLGLFPSAQMIMFEDLDPDTINLDGKVIENLFSATNTEKSPLFAPDYNVDDPSIESRITGLALEADSSQFSTIVDVIEGKNIAVEGPPGTGKSQTITNVIANAIAAGKKVLFVAEKLAALEVVHSKLKGLGLDVHALPLHSTKGSREQVIKSIRQRLEYQEVSSTAIRDLELKKQAYTTARARLAEYIATMQQPYGAGDNVSSVIGKGIVEWEILRNLPFSLRQQTAMSLDAVEKCYSQLEEIIEHAKEFEKSWKNALATDSIWRGVQNIGTSIMMRDTMRHLLSEASEALRKEAGKQAAVEALSLPIDTSILEDVDDLARKFLILSSSPNRQILSEAIRNNSVDATLSFLLECNKVQREQFELAKTVSQTDDPSAIDSIRQIHALCTSNDQLFIRPDEWQNGLRALEREFYEMRKNYAAVDSFIQKYPELARVPGNVLSEAASLLRNTAPEVYLSCIPDLNEFTAISKAESICTAGRQLVAERNRLEKSVIVSEIPYEPGHLEICADVLAATRFWGKPFSKFKTAKTAYFQVSTISAFDQLHAASTMRSLAKWMRSIEQFNSDETANKVFNNHFKGLDSDFELLEKMVKYSRNVASLLADENTGDFLPLLLSGRRQFINSVMEIPENLPRLTVAELREKLREGEKKLSQVTNFVLSITPLLTVLATPDNTIVSLLPTIADKLYKHQTLVERLNSDSTAAACLKTLYKGAATKVDALHTEIESLRLLQQFRYRHDQLLPLLETNGWQKAIESISEFRDAKSDTTRQVRALEAHYGIPFEVRITGMSPVDAALYLETAARDEDGFRVHVDYAYKRSVVAKDELAWVIDVFEAEGLDPSEFSKILHAVVVRAAVNAIDKKYGPIVSGDKYGGEKLGKLRNEIAKLDQEITKLNRLLIDKCSYASCTHIPGKFGKVVSQHTEGALITHEVGKKRMHIPTRELTRRAGKALRELKPCWMMSPLAVAQYLPKSDDPLFDLCIIDEASQMPPENALGALLRSKQVMVVGDTNQLPPTNFFKASVEADDNDDEADSSPPVESILQLANGTFQPARRLRWHYRSRHSALIQFSNREIYNNELVIFPSPSESRPDMGVSLVKVDGDYHAGLNGREASRIVEAAVEFMYNFPDRSLGIVTLNKQQCSHINEKMERVMEKDPVVAKYVQDRSDGLESFFIKNLENVQGDERDVIFISTVYGPDSETGKLSLGIGPITQGGGPRRLNVLFTRAREKIVTFSSMSPSDIQPGPSGSQGVRMLKRWLEYCEAGGKSQTTLLNETTPDSAFVSYVAKHINAMGCNTSLNVGISGYCIDIGVSHPKWPDEFILGVECDGSSYFSYRCARDRDSLREKVLHGLGWRLHRIWSYDWFNHPDKAIEQLQSVIRGRLKELGITNTTNSAS